MHMVENVSPPHLVDAMLLHIANNMLSDLVHLKGKLVISANLAVLAPVLHSFDSLQVPMACLVYLLS